MTNRAPLLGLLLAAAPAAAQPVPEPELLRRVISATDSLSGAGEFSGVILLARNGEPVLERAYGMADREARRPNDIETAFNIGSINKIFTVIALRQLEAQGRLHFDSTLASYWPDFPHRDIAARVTIRQLMQHRSGVSGNIFAAPAGRQRHDVRHNNDFLPLVSPTLAFEPGARQEYSNAGYVVLGMLIERLSGQDYYEYVRQHVYEPAGMTRTGAWPVDSLPANTAIGYTREGGATEAERNTALLPGRGSAAGGGYSTARDLMRFLQALRERRIAAGTPAGIGVSGGAGGINAVVEGGLPGGYDMVVMANGDPPMAIRIARIVREALGARD